MNKVVPSSRAKSISYAIRELIAIAKEREAKGEKIIYLTSGDPVKYGLRPPQEVVDALKLAATEEIHGYGFFAGEQDLREEIARYEDRKTGAPINPEDVIVTSGSIEAFHALVIALLESGQGLLLPNPYYAPYKSIVEVYGGRVGYYRLLDEDGAWRIDLDSFEKELAKGAYKGVLVINPNNPTGAVFPTKDVRQLVDIALQHGAIPIFDEAYDLFVYEGEFTNAASILKDAAGIVLNSLSKSLFIPGWRVGYAYRVGQIADDFWATFKKVLMLKISGPKPLQKAAAILLKMVKPEEFAKSVLGEIKRRREAFMKHLREVESLEGNPPQGSFFAFPRIVLPGWEQRDKEFVMRLLDEKKVLIVHGSGFGERGTGHVRIAFIAREDTLAEAFRRIKEFEGRL